jgi:hypothetical protein
MNPSHGNMPHPDDPRLDLLVDGELPEAERRRLLAALEETPGAWRRCALAFLEAQAWRQEMAAIGRQQRPEPQAARAVTWRGFRRSNWGTLLAVAASFLIAFGLGVVLDDVWRPAGPATPPPFQIAGTPQGSQEPAPQTIEPDILPAPDAPSGPWELVTVPVADSGGEAGTIQVPAMELQRLGPQWVDRFPRPTLPVELLEALRQSGHRIRRDRLLLPVPMEDGRQLVVPVDQFEFRYVGDSAYQ